MSLRGSIPSFVSVADFPLRVFHAGQPVFCSICHESEASASRLPFTGSVPALQAARSHGPLTVHSPGVRPVPVPVLLCLLRLRLLPLLSLCRPPCRLPRHLYTLPLSSLRLCNPFCHQLLSRPLLCLLLCHVSSLMNLLLLKMERSLCLPIFRWLMPLHHGVLVHVLLLPLTTRNLSVLSSQMKLGSDSSTVKKLCLSIVKTHKLSVSDDECARVAASVCSNF